MYTYEKPDNLVDWYESSFKRFADNTLFLVKTEKNPLHPITYKEIGTRIDNLRGALAHLGLKKGESVGIISKNRPEWVVVEVAAYGCGARYIPMYEKELYETWKYIIKDGNVKFLFVPNEEIYKRVKGLVDEIPTLEKIFIIDAEGKTASRRLKNSANRTPSSRLSHSSAIPRSSSIHRAPRASRRASS